MLGNSPDAPLQDRLKMAIAHCGSGLTQSRGAQNWTMNNAFEATILQLPAGNAKCVRGIVVVSVPGQSAQVSLIDAKGRTLASASNSGTIVVPEDGPLCVPGEVTLELRVSAETASLTGMASLLESP